MAVQETQDEICRKALCTLFPASRPRDRVISVINLKIEKVKAFQPASYPAYLSYGSKDEYLFLITI